MRKHTSFYETLDDGTEIELELEYEPVKGSLLQAKVADKYVVGYLVYDCDSEYDDLMGDCMGKMYSSHRRSGQHSDMQDALGLDSSWESNLSIIFERHYEEALKRYTEKIIDTRGIPFLVEHYSQSYEREHDEESDELFVRHCIKENCEEARDWDYTDFYNDMQDVLESMFNEPEYFPGDKDAVALDCYEHGSQWWSLSGGGMQCRWDTARGAGVWVPDECLREQLDGDEAAGKLRHECARMYAQQFLDQHNAIINGDVWGCVVHVYDENGEIEDIEISDECWGFVGSEYAEEALKTEFFEPSCKRVAEDYARDVKTQGGKQMEMGV